MRRPDYRPLTAQELAAELVVPPQGVKAFAARVVALEKEGRVARVRQNRYILPAEADLFTGRISFHSKGFAFIGNEGEGEDLFIAPEDTGTAMHGDRVVARIQRPSRGGDFRTGTPGRTRGRVLRILVRASETIVGTLQKTRQFHYVVADDPRFPHNVYVSPKGPAGGRAPSPGDKVVVKLFPWESRHVNPEGRIVEVLGRADAPGVDMLSVVRKHHLPEAFAPEVLAETKRFSTGVGPADLDGREDCRADAVFTIDPEDARDFDDAVRVEKTPQGWRLSVHIADVSHYVKPGGALDHEAFQRGNSTYLADRVIPMLPEKLSNGLCSLNPHVDRLAFSAFLEFGQDGKPGRARFARTVIRSAARLTYREAFEILEGRADHALAADIRIAWDLASVLRRKRFSAGSLDLDFPEIKVRLDARGIPVAMEKIENDISHQLVEEFMLAANESVAHLLKNRQRPTLYRVHEAPDPRRLADFREFASGLGFPAGDLTNRGELQGLLMRTRGTPEEYAVKISLLKSLQKARYDARPLGHYGLTKENYTHFTSPIRRYADLIVHRTLARWLEDEAGGGGKKKSGAAASTDLPSIAVHISATERTSQDAERESVEIKKLEFFERSATEGTTFQAIVVDVRNYGLAVELPDILTSGVVHVSALEDDFYVFDPAATRLRGRRFGRLVRVGDRMTVRVSRVDRFKREIDFAPANAETDTPPPRSTKKPSPVGTRL